jgi:REP element-mobilizing transposase RayT
MPDHLHWQFQLLEKYSLAEVIKRMKGRSAQALNMQKNKQGKVWQVDYYEHHIKSESDLINQARYIVANPLRAGLADNVSDYDFWDCIYLK